MGAQVDTAFVPAAGLGTRLKAITRVVPKPLVPIFNRPLIERVFDRLIEVGVRRFAVNTHHLPEVFARAFASGEYRGCPIAFFHEPVLLDTGGGLRNAAPALGDGPFLVHNGDIWTSVPIAKALRRHAESGNEVTLVLRSGGGPKEIVFEEASGRVRDIGRRLEPSAEPGHVFTGISVVNRSFLDRIPEDRVVSIVPFWVEAISDGKGVGGVVCDEGFWHDLGSRERLLDAHREHAGEAPAIHPEAVMEQPVAVDRFSAVGRGCRVGAGARIKNSILMEGAEVEAGSKLTRCVVGPGARAAGELEGADVFA